VEIRGYLLYILLCFLLSFDLLVALRQAGLNQKWSSRSSESSFIKTSTTSFWTNFAYRWSSSKRSSLSSVPSSFSRHILPNLIQLRIPVASRQAGLEQQMSPLSSTSSSFSNQVLHSPINIPLPTASRQADLNQKKFPLSPKPSSHPKTSPTQLHLLSSTSSTTPSSEPLFQWRSTDSYQIPSRTTIPNTTSTQKPFGSPRDYSNHHNPRSEG